MDEASFEAHGKGEEEGESGLPDGYSYSQILRLYVFGPSGLRDYRSATLCCKI